jgi:flagellar assembly protein FliH
MNSMFALPVAAFKYRDLAGFPASVGLTNLPPATKSGDGTGKVHMEPLPSKEEIEERIKAARSEAVLQTEQRLRQEYEQKLQSARASLAAAIGAFETERDEYYARVEAEVVQLALAIAARILHREAQVDPMLVAALVRIATERLRDGSSVIVRVAPGHGKQWKEYFDRQPNVRRIDVMEREGLSDTDCVIETELGIANLGLDTQLKEVEQGFFDLLALRPVNQ